MGDARPWHRHRALRVLAVLLALAAVTLSAACGPGGSVQGLDGRSAGATPSPTPPPVPFTLAVTPAEGAKNLPISSEVGIALTGGQITDVTFTKAGTTAKIAGSLRADGSAWVPDAPLGFSTTYQAAVTGKSADGNQTDTKTTSFTTMGAFGRETGTGLYLFNGQTVGVAMPIVLEFNPAVPESSRAEVQKRLFVTSSPAQPGAWHWASGNQVWYRPPNYWLPGTTLAVRAGLRGVPMGEGRYGDTDRSATVTVGPKVLLEVDNATKKMNVYVDNQLAKTAPVSLGKPSTPSSSGHMVIMSKHENYTFDTRGEPNGGYVVDVNHAMRLTWGGEFFHGAPWSVGDQGVRNVSHGCVNLSAGNAAWTFNTAHIGDPVVVRGTEVALNHGNGWTAWNIPWSEYVKGSALPVPPELAAVVSTPESVEASAKTPPPPPPAATPTATPSPGASPVG